MPTNINIFFSNAGTRNDVRERVINVFMQEQPGTGTGNLASKYLYFVEVLHGGNRIILQRPANLKNGFDFLIRVENIDFSNGHGRYRDNPSHEDILGDLMVKKNENRYLFNQLYNCINATYECNEIDDRWFQNLVFQHGYPCDLLVKTIKWFFIEQDIRYWNYSGRDMLMSHINQI